MWRGTGWTCLCTRSRRVSGSISGYFGWRVLLCLHLRQGKGRDTHTFPSGRTAIPSGECLGKMYEITRLKFLPAPSTYGGPHVIWRKKQYRPCLTNELHRSYNILVLYRPMIYYIIPIWARAIFYLSSSTVLEYIRVTSSLLLIVNR